MLNPAPVRFRSDAADTSEAVVPAPRSTPQPAPVAADIHAGKFAAKTLVANPEDKPRAQLPAEPAGTVAPSQSKIHAADPPSPRAAGEVAFLQPSLVNSQSRNNPAPLKSRLPEAAHPPVVRPEPKPRPDPVSSVAKDHPLLKPESVVMGRVPSTPPAGGSHEPRPAQETRNIQVKIGKVEIRSNQPTPALRKTPPSRTSGFDNLRLTRTYLDRGGW
jgi:hypothetical protein